MTDRLDVIAVSPAEAAALLGISRSKLYELLSRGVIRSVRIGTARRVRVAELERFVKELEDIQLAKGAHEREVGR